MIDLTSIHLLFKIEKPGPSNEYRNVLLEDLNPKWPT